MTTKITCDHCGRELGLRRVRVESTGYEWVSDGSERDFCDYACFARHVAKWPHLAKELFAKLEPK